MINLNPQELHAARLASQGLSHNGIGQQLFLSLCTIGYHLHRLFPKLGVTSRGGLAHALASAAVS